MNQIRRIAAMSCLAYNALAGPPPEILSLFPIGVPRGATVEAELRGKHLDGLYGAWFEDAGFKASLATVELDTSEAPPMVTRRTEAADQTARQKVLLRLEIAPDAAVGKHSIRVVGPGGISKPAQFLVHSDAAVFEAAGEHDTPSRAQPVRIPLLLEGRLARMGEVDYYSFEADAGQDILIHATSNTASNAGGYDALQFTLYEPAGSWFDPHRPNRLAFSDQPRISYRFGKRGRYLLAVSGYMGIGGPDCSYQLRMHSNDETHSEQLQLSIIDQLQQTFRRKLGTDRAEQLLARTVYPPPQSPKPSGNAAQEGAEAPSPAQHASNAPLSDMKALYAIVEESDSDEDAIREFAFPALIQGALDRPGDVDKFKFKARAGQRIALEIETPASSLPDFTPRIALYDAKGEEILNNIWRRVGGDNNQWMKTLQPKATYVFDKDGEYVLEVRNLVGYLYGDKSFRYRLLVRPQAPHVGKIESKEDRVNLVAGQAEKLTFIADQEEGYNGDIALAFENLPPGVQALPAVEVEPEPLPKLDEGHKERFVPKKQKLAILLIAAPDAPATRSPHKVRVTARAVMDKQLGAILPVQNIPVMVLARSSK